MSEAAHIALKEARAYIEELENELKWVAERIENGAEFYRISKGEFAEQKHLARFCDEYCATQYVMRGKTPPQDLLDRLREGYEEREAAAKAQKEEIFAAVRASIGAAKSPPVEIPYRDYIPSMPGASALLREL